MLFKMSDLGLLSYYLGIEVTQSNDSITLCQRSYAEKILEAAGMEGCHGCQTPMECRLKLRKNDDAKLVDPSLYRSIIGSLRYLVHSRPDITHAVGIVSRYMERPTVTHWTAVKQILRYVRSTLSYGCCYGRGSGKSELLCYSDSDHAGDVEDRKSTSGQIFFLGSNPVTWSSQKQKIVANSSCEAEYVAATSAATQGLGWPGCLVNSMGEKSRQSG